LSLIGVIVHSVEIVTFILLSALFVGFSNEYKCDGL